MIQLRPAVLSDKPRLFRWLSELSFSSINMDSSDAGNATDHIKRLKRGLRDSHFIEEKKWLSRCFTIQCESRHFYYDVGAVGYTKLGIGNVVEIIVFLKNPKLYGYGFGTYALKMMIAEINNLGFDFAIARIPVENIRAARAFEKAGFKKSKHPELLYNSSGLDVTPGQESAESDDQCLTFYYSFDSHYRE